MRSRLYECRVMHHRLRPRRHRFDYRVFMLALDLDELDAVHQRHGLFSVNRANLFCIREDDYLPPNEQVHNPSRVGADATALAPASLKERVQVVLARHGINGAVGRVELITFPRVLGYSFNPVSFYFCWDDAGRPQAAIAEVTNTFREVKPYVLPADTWQSGAFRLCVPKHFYVSPFSDVDVAFDFTLRPPAERMAIAIDDREAGDRSLVTTLTGRARPLSDRALAWCAIRYPLLTAQVIARIHWHALRLWLKRVPWFAKAARPADQRDLLRPHRSLRDAA